MISGFALVDKPADWTSHDVVGRLRRLYGQRRVGHAGTLDPMATGVLIVGLGQATRLLRFVQGQPKTYEATIRLGESTVTDDAQGETVDRPGWQLDPAALDAQMAELTGEIQQVPSAVSAVKVDGVRSYARVRQGQDVELSPRPVSITRFERLGVARVADDVVDVDVVVECSSGTYIRALARDLGHALGSAGHLTALRRTAIGEVTADMCSALSDDAPPVVPAAEVMSEILPTVELDSSAVTDLGFGRAVAAAGEGLCAAVDAAGEFLAVLDVVDGRGSVVVNLAGS